MAHDLDCTLNDLMTQALLRKKIKLSNYVSETVGLPTLNDIMEELAKPGRDPREKFEAFEFAREAEKIEDLKPGMKLPGIITNVTRFGAFVDIGVHQDGLLHVSQMSDNFVKDPSDIVKVHQKVMVTIIEIDIARNRISLSLKSTPSSALSSHNDLPKQKKHTPSPKESKSKKEPFNNPFANVFGKM